MSDKEVNLIKNNTLSGVNVVLSLAAAFGTAVLYNNVDDDELNIKALFLGIALLTSVIHGAHAILIFILPAFQGGKPRDQSDLEVVVRNKMSQLLLISSAVVLGMDLRTGEYGGLEITNDEGPTNVTPSLIILCIAAALRLSDMFDDLHKAVDAFAVVCDDREPEGTRKSSALARMIIANLLYAISAALLITQFAEEEVTDKSGTRDTRGRDIQIAAMSLAIIHAALKPLIKGAEMLGGDGLKQAVANTFLEDKCTGEDVELASLSQLPIVRLIVASSILALAGLQLGETWKDHRDINFAAGGILAYSFAEDIGRNLL